MSETRAERGATVARTQNSKSTRHGVEIKSAPLRIKATDEADGQGTVTAVVSVFDNVDSYGDVMLKGAFADTLAEHKDAGNTVPFMWSHESADPFAYIGELAEAEETDEGLQVKAVFDLDNPTAVQVYKLLKGRRLREFSFGFIPRKTVPGERDGEPVREVKSVELLEVSVVHVGANRATRVVEVRSAPDGDGEESEPQLKVADVEELVKGAEGLLDAIDAVRGTIAEKLGDLQATVKSLRETSTDDPDSSGSSHTEERAAASAAPGRPEEHASAKGSPTGAGAAAVTAADVLTDASALLAIIDTEGVF